MSYALLILLALVAVATGVYAWARGPIRRGLRARSFAALARRLDAELAPRGDGFTRLGFLPTVVAVYGAQGRLRNVLTAKRGDGSPVLFCEYLFTIGGEWRWWRRKVSAAIVAAETASPLPLFTLKRARRSSVEGKTEFRVDGQRLVVQIVAGEVEVWSTEQEKNRVRRLVTPQLRQSFARGSKWDIRSMAGWLVVLHHAPLSAWRIGPLEAHRQAALGLLAALS